MTNSPWCADNDRTGTVKKLFSGTVVLVVATVITKIIGFLYKVPLVHYVGIEGMAYFLAANHVYILLFVLSTSGLPVAISVLVSKAVATGDRSAVMKIYNVAIGLFIIIGMVGSLTMLAGASKISDMIGIPKATWCIIAIAPAVLMACIAGAIRGYFQGQQIMHHTAISQVIESFGKLIFGLVGAIYAINRNMSTEKVAAFAIFGITVGVGLSMVYLIIVKAFFDKNKIGSIKVMPYSNKTSIIKQLVRLALPITLSSSVLSIGGAIDTMLVPKSLAYCGFSASEANRMYSCYGNMAVPLFSLIPAFIAPIAMALVPMVSTHHNSNSIREEKIAICQSIKMTLFVAAPASLGLAFFAGPVLQMIFPTDINTIGIASSLLSILALSIVPACLITTTNAILQAQSHAQKTIFSMICGVLVKLVVEYFLIRQRDINIFGAPISTLACDITVISINFYYVIKYSPQLKELVRDCIGIVWTSILAMGGTVVIWYTTGMKDSGSNVATALAVFIAMVLYFGIAWLFGIVDSTISNVIPDFNNNLIKRKNKNEQRREDKVFTKQRAL